MASRESKKAVRHAEGRRTSTCRFADRVAAISVDHYKKNVPAQFRETQKQTCLATVICHELGTGTLRVLAMGVGTKFLPEAVLLDHENNGTYGDRVRDCHAEVLARRAFRRFLTQEITRDSQGEKKAVDTKILQRTNSEERHQLRPGITLHFYCSSTPCGNSVIKKFCTLKKEVFRDDLDDNQWPSDRHEHIPGHSLHLGQFALLVKKDNSSNETNSSVDSDSLSPRKKRILSKKQAQWPVNCQTDWCPPGTTTVWSEKGGLHTCSDKMARWNYLGLQGSLLSSMLVSPLCVSSLTVGRKFSASTCRRAVCCRVDKDDCPSDADFQIRHPAVMGTQVYMDETGVIDMSLEREKGQDVRFHNSQSWVSWLDRDGHVVECIDGSTGYAISSDGSTTSSTAFQDEKGCAVISQISTTALVNDFLEIQKRITVPNTLQGLRELKLSIAQPYEDAKNKLLTKHPVFRDWKRRATC